jgi:hypothetical protein
MIGPSRPLARPPSLKQVFDKTGKADESFAQATTCDAMDTFEANQRFRRKLIGCC